MKIDQGAQISTTGSITAPNGFLALVVRGGDEPPAVDLDELLLADAHHRDGRGR